jgi:hypothetical protein
MLLVLVTAFIKQWPNKQTGNLEPLGVIGAAML